MAVKNVAISTWWHHYNYGSALQATATYNVLKGLGYSPDIINYKPEDKTYPTNPVADAEHRENWIKYPRIVDDVRDEKFEKYFKTHLTFTHEAQNDDQFENLNSKYDAFITGSDQIWAPRVFNERYYLDFVQDNRKKIAYAPSIGLSTVENEFVKTRMYELISQFAHISVREEQGANIIKNELGIDRVAVMPDPTLLLNYNEWRSIIPAKKGLKKKYILCYFLGENENAWKHVEKIAEQTGYDTRVIPILQKDAGRGCSMEGVGPEEFFNLVDGAEAVLTDSFHGAIFSIITKTPFYVFERFKAASGGSQNSRVYNLLETVHFQDRLIKYDDTPLDEYELSVKFTDAHKIIAKQRNQAIDYLKKSLAIETPLVSILVAAYNVEKYIKQCLASISAQTYKNIEIIIVDDGTPDNSGKIADEYASKELRAKVIHKANGGLSTARNTGLDHASGEYIMFVDGDDAIAPDCVEYFVGLIENTGTQIATSKKRWEEWDDGLPVNDKFEVWTSAQAIQGIFEWTLPEEVWNKIYSRSLIEKHHLRFKTEFLSSEGQTFNHFAIEKTDGVAVGYRRVWFYRSNPESATRATDIKRWETCFDAHQYKKANLKIWNKDIERAWRLHVWWSYCSVSRVIYQAGEEKKYAKNLRNYKWNIRRHILWGIFGVPAGALRSRNIKIFFNPKKVLQQVTDDIVANRQKNNTIDPDIMPWEIKVAAPEVGPLVEKVVTPQELEIQRLQAELDSFLSVKRSVRLLLGNIKRHYARGPLGRLTRALRIRTRIRGLLRTLKYIPNKIYWVLKNLFINHKIRKINREKLEERDRIPKVLHYIWVGGNPKPESVEKYIATWRKYCPDYAIIEWNEQNYNIKKNRYTREAYAAKKWAFVTDYMRLDILDRFGGIYMDSDVEILKSLDAFLKDPAFSSFEAGDMDVNGIFLPTGMMASEKGNRWIKYLKTYYDNDRSFYLPDGSMDTVTNTNIITRMTVEKYGIRLDDTLQETTDFTMYPHDYFCPKSWSTRKITLTKNSHTIHHFAGSWWAQKTRDLLHKDDKF